MKKLISLILSAILTFSVISNMNVKAADIKRQAMNAYAHIVQQYLTAEKLGEDAFNNPELKDVNPKFIGMCGEASYCIKDINNDGIPELFIGEFDICTYHNGKVVHLHQGKDWELGERLHYTLCKNGIIEVASGGGYYDYKFYYKPPKNKGKFKETCYLRYDVENITNRVSYYTGNTEKDKEKKISEEKYNKLYKKYHKPVKMTFYDADSKAVDNLRNGVISYPGQKKIIVKDGF